MVIETLLITQDAELLKLLRGALKPLDISLNVRSDTDTAVEISARRHFNGLIIDCDDLPRGDVLLRQLRAVRSTKSSIFVAVVNGRTTPAGATRLGANFVLAKPVTSDRAHRLLAAAMVPMAQDCRRYFRHKVDICASVTPAVGCCSSARIVNISEGGLAMEFPRPESLDGVLGITFEIPSIDRPLVQARAEVAWTDMRRAGMRFISVSPEARQKLDAWLKALYGKEQLPRMLEDPAAE
jgi:ActR/RegA family two-component response regulator